MGEVIQLKDYRDLPLCEENRLRAPALKPTDSSEEPKFVVRNPLFVAKDTLMMVRNFLSKAIQIFNPDYLFMPITNDLEPFWELNVDKGWFNSPFPPYTALFMALRDYPREFAQLVDGRLVNYQRDYDKLLDSFNRVHIRAIEHKGSGYPKGVLSKDELLRMTALFYCLLMTSDRSTGMVFDKMGHLCNGWGGQPKIVNLNYKLASFYAGRLKECAFTGVSWNQFMFQSINAHRDDRVAWLFNLTSFDAIEGSPQWNFGLQDFINLLDMVRLLDSSNHHVTIILQNTTEIRDFMRTVYNQGLYFDSQVLGRKYSVISNYRFVR